MADLIEFLEARWDEEEAVARAAIPEGGSGSWPWTCQHEGMEQPPPSHDLCAWLGGCDEEIDLHDDGGHSVEQAQHIAYWDPARVLAEIDAKRALLYFLDPREAPSGEGRFVAERVLVLLAQPHRSHPDFDPTWSMR